jgi:hypothetical protein
MTPAEFQAIKRSNTAPVSTTYTPASGTTAIEPVCHTVTCCGDDEPVANYTSDHPEHETFVAIGFFKDPPRIDDPPNQGENCVIPAISTISDEQGRVVASFNVKECVWNQFTYPPTDEGANPPSGPHAVMYCNDEQWCEFICPDGGTYHHHVPAGIVCELSKDWANFLAVNLCNQGAMNERFCIEGNPPCGCLGEYYQWLIQTSGRDGAYTIKEVTGLPAGLIAASNIITGTPTATGTAQVYIALQDSSGNWTERTVTLRIINITTASPLPSTMVGERYTQTLDCSGCGWFSTWELVSGTLPDGMTLDEHGVISGQPTTAGTYKFRIGVNC